MQRKKLGQVEFQLPNYKMIATGQAKIIRTSHFGKKKEDKKGVF